MKRVQLLYTGIVCLAVTAYSSHANHKTPLNKPNYEVKKHSLAYEQTTSQVPLRKTYPLSKFRNNILNAAESPKGIKVGFTYYDFQTNACMPERVVVGNEPGSDGVFAQMFWMASTDSTRGEFQAGQPGAAGFNDSRGAYYSLLDISDPKNIQNFTTDWEKIPTENGLRRGWPNIVQFKDGTVGVSTHTPMNFSYNTSFGSLPNRKVEVAVGETLWGRIAVDGKDYVHMIYTYQVASGSPATLYYRRSTDRGRNWSDETLLSDDGQLQGGDVYAISANGDNVVAVFGTRGLQLAYKKSTDNGETWSDALVLMNPQFTDGTVVDDPFGSNSVKVYTDTLLSCGNHVDVIVDNEGVAHFVFNEMVAYVIRDGARDGDSVVIQSGTIYGMDDINVYAGRKLGFCYWKEGDEKRYRITPPTFTKAAENSDIVSRRAYSGIVRYPQLGLGADNSLYLAYNSVVEGDVKEVAIDTNTTKDGVPDQTINGYMGHVFLTHKPAGGTDWSMPVNITPNGNDCLFPSLSNTVNDYMYVTYSSDNTPGDRVTNTELPTEETGVYFEVVSKEVLSKEMYSPEAVGFLETVKVTGLDKSLTSVNDYFESGSGEIVLVPNPASDELSIKFVTNLSSKVSVNVVNSLGIPVLSHSANNADTQEIVLSLKTLPCGAYTLIVKSNNTVNAENFVISR